MVISQSNRGCGQIKRAVGIYLFSFAGSTAKHFLARSVDSWQSPPQQDSCRGEKRKKQYLTLEKKNDFYILKKKKRKRRIFAPWKPVAQVMLVIRWI